MASPGSSFLGRHEFLLRRLHSLSGLIPVGAYMCVHLATNASVLNGAASFQKNVDAIHSLGRVLPVVEWAFIFLPLLFHMALGFVFIFGASPNAQKYRYGSNVRYTWQRITGMIAAAFIFYHVLTLHHLGLGWFEPHHATSSTATALQSRPWVPIIYLVGVLSCVFHLANGLWTMGITWGVWTSPAGQRRAGYACTVFGVLLGLVGVTAMAGFTGMSEAAKAKAIAVEQKMEEQRQEIESAGADLEESTEPESTAAAEKNRAASSASTSAP